MTKVARGATLLFVQGFLSFIIGLVYFMIMARFFTLGEMGIFIVLSFILNLAQVVTTFAFSSAVPKFIAQHIAERQEDKAKEVIIRVLQVFFTAAILFSILLFVLADLLSFLFLGNYSWIFHFQLAVIASFFAALYIIVLSVLQGLQRIGKMAALSLIFVVSQASLGIFLLSLGFGLLGVLYGWIFGYAFACILGLLFSFKYVKGWKTRSAYPLKSLFDFALPLYFSGLLAFVLSWVDQIFVLPYQGVADLGIYGFMIRASGVPMLITTSVFTVLLPQLSQLYVIQGEKGLKEAFFLSSRYAILVGFPLTIGLAVLARPSLILFGGEQYAVATFPLIILCLATLPSILGVAIGPTFMVLNRTKPYSLSIVVSIICNSVLCYFMLTYLDLGILGASLARLISQCVNLVLGFLLLRKIVNLKFDYRMFLKAGVSTGIMAIALIILDLAREGFKFSSQLLVFRLHLLPVYVFFGGFVYVVSIILFRGITKFDIELLGRYLPQSLRSIVNWLSRVARAENE
ncbi:MAG: oligosaccharide flippase family protein [Ignavibacterium sp.]|nr:oligosaccharide flippase family protein [Ignavibacterium sp.]